jgi:hypothetical protein
MRFVGRAAPVGDAGGAWRIALAAPSKLLHVVDFDDSQCPFTPLREVEVTVDLEVIFTAEQTFLAFGVLRMGDRHRLRLATLGSGYLGPSADIEARQGAVIWRVERGEGQFAGASGLIASTFMVNEALGVIDHQVGVLVLP